MKNENQIHDVAERMRGGLVIEGKDYGSSADVLFCRLPDLHRRSAASAGLVGANHTGDHRHGGRHRIEDLEEPAAMVTQSPITYIKPTSTTDR
jgi:hypothetical protein